MFSSNGTTSACRVRFVLHTTFFRVQKRKICRPALSILYISTLRVCFCLASNAENPRNLMKPRFTYPNNTSQDILHILQFLFVSKKSSSPIGHHIVFLQATSRRTYWCPRCHPRKSRIGLWSPKRCCFADTFWRCWALKGHHVSGVLFI